MTDKTTDNEHDTHTKAAATPPPGGKPPDTTAKPGPDKPVQATPDPAAPRSGGGAPPTRGGGGGKGLAALALLLALGALGASGYLWTLYRQAAEQQPDPEAQLQQATEQFNQRLEQALAEVSQQRQAAIEDINQQVQTALGQSETLRGESESIRQTLESETGTLKSELQTLREASQAVRADNQTLRTRVQSLEQELASAEEELQGLEQLIGGASEEQLEQVATLANRIENLQLSQRGLLNTLEAVREVASRGGDVNALPLSEVEYLLRVADHKLAFQDNVTAAQDALRIAERRLESVNEPQFNNVLRMIRENVATLRGVDLPDYSGLAQRIAELEQRVDQLPIEIEVQAASRKEQVRPKVQEEGVINLEDEQPWYEKAGDVVWRQFKDIVVIRNERSSGPPLIAVEEEYFLRQNLRLELEAMRLALLREDAGSYQDSLERAREWIRTYFDTDSQPVEDVLDNLNELQTVQMNPYIPDLTGTLQAFRDVMEVREPVRSVLPTREAAAEQSARAAQAQEAMETPTIGEQVSEPMDEPADASPAEAPMTEAQEPTAEAETEAPAATEVGEPTAETEAPASEPAEGSTATDESGTVPADEAEDAAQEAQQ